MTVKVHPVKEYGYSFDARTGGPGKVQLFGSLGVIADLVFVDDVAAVPAPVIAPDLNSATVFFRRSALAGVIGLLRNQRPVNVSLDDQGRADITRSIGLAESRVVCATCSPALLAAKNDGIRAAMRRLVEFCGADATPAECPMTFHLDGDDYCGAYQNGMTGFFGEDSAGLGQICLFDVEKENRAAPFTVENAVKPQDQLLAVHEAMHGWFMGRQENYRVQEPFCKLVSFVVSEAAGGPDYCGWFAATPDDHPDALMKHLCAIGMTAAISARVLARLAHAASRKGAPLNDTEFAVLVGGVLGKDAAPAFLAAGIPVQA